MHNIMPRIHPLVIIAAVSAIIFSIIGVAAVTGQINFVYPETGGPAIRPERTGIKPNITPIVVVNRASIQNVERAELCANCALVDSIVVNKVKADTGGVDLAYGDMTRDQTAATSSYQVGVRMDDGTYRVVSLQDRPVFRIGDKVKIVNGAIVKLESTAMSDKNRLFALMLAALTGRVF